MADARSPVPPDKWGVGYVPWCPGQCDGCNRVIHLPDVVITCPNEECKTAVYLYRDGRCNLHLSMGGYRCPACGCPVHVARIIIAFCGGPRMRPLLLLGNRIYVLFRGRCPRCRADILAPDVKYPTDERCHSAGCGRRSLRGFKRQLTTRYHPDDDPYRRW